jgi:hypothetical protein
MSSQEASERRRDQRRSTRVPIRVQIHVRATGLTCAGETIVVNLHGALVKAERELKLNDAITIEVPLTGKTAAARVVHASKQTPLEYGIGLDQPQNIWGIQLPPPDWHDEHE